MKGADIAVVIPTVGRTSLAEALTAIGGGTDHPALIVVVDDRSEPDRALPLPAVLSQVRVVLSGGRGPAAARNANGTT